MAHLHYTDSIAMFITNVKRINLVGSRSSRKIYVFSGDSDEILYYLILCYVVHKKTLSSENFRHGGKHSF